MEKIKNKIYLTLICLLFVQICKAQPKDKVIDKIAAVVGLSLIHI